MKTASILLLCMSCISFSQEIENTYSIYDVESRIWLRELIEDNKCLQQFVLKYTTFDPNEIFYVKLNNFSKNISSCESVINLEPIADEPFLGKCKPIVIVDQNGRAYYCIVEFYPNVGRMELWKIKHLENDLYVSEELIGTVYANLCKEILNLLR